MSTLWGALCPSNLQLEDHGLFFSIGNTLGPIKMSQLGENLNTLRIKHDGML